ncbi:hypothetical protein [Halobaculum sp. EA56]|uniref:hypothetical protein n=1 Tax=Halobaculum sp. EA56 TaxID=3421648 RepID=UPI003EBC3B65
MSDAGPTIDEDFPLNRDDIVCPECGSDEAFPTRILTDKEVESEARGEIRSGWKNFIGGAAGGAAIGYIFGPAGAFFGGVLGAAKGSSDAEEMNAKIRTHVRCDDCGYFGDAAGNSIK